MGTKYFPLFTVEDYGLNLPLLNTLMWESSTKNEFISCGGIFSSDVNDAKVPGFENNVCQKFANQKWSPMKSLRLLEPRNSSGFSFHSDKKSAWITGGFTYEFYNEQENILKTKKSTERVVDGITLEKGPDMPFTLAGHCTAHVGGDVFFVAGGYQQDFKSTTTTTFLQVK